MSIGQLVKWARESIGRTEKRSTMRCSTGWRADSYLHGDVTDSQLYDSLAELIGSACRRFLLPGNAMALFRADCQLANVRLLERRTRCRVKPFGHDRPPRSELNARLRRCWVN